MISINHQENKRKISNNELNIKAAIRFIIVLLAFFPYIIIQLREYSIVDLTFTAILIQSIFFLCLVGGRNLTLLNIYFLFSLIFFATAGWLQYINEVIIWNHSIFPKIDYVITNLIILFSNFLIYFSYYFSYKQKNAKILINITKDNLAKRSGECLILPFVLMSLSLISLYILLYMNDFSIMSLFLRGLIDEEFDGIIVSSTILMIVDKLVRLVPFFAFLYLYIQKKQKSLYKVMLFILLVVCAFPTGISRYMVAFVYIPVLILVFPRLSNGFNFSYLLIGSIVFIFPFLNQFRDSSRASSIVFLPSSDLFLTGHFDAYENLMNVIHLDLLTYGHQLLGVLLFFVPRSVWYGKPVGSGHHLAQVADLSFNNISMPFIGEGYINFGILGVIIFSVAAGWVMGSLDKRFNGFNSRINPTYSYAIYLYFCGALIFILRGDLLSSFAYVMSGLFSALLVFGVAITTGALFPYQKKD